MERLNGMMEEYEKLKKKLESKGYSGIVEYKQVPLRNRIMCRLVQLAMAVFFMAILFSAKLLREYFVIRKDVPAGIILLMAILFIWFYMHMFVDWCFRGAMRSGSARIQTLPVNGYHAKRKVRRGIEALQREIAQLDEKKRRLEPILEKISGAAEMIESQLGGETELVKEVGRNPRFRATIAKDEVLARIIQSENDVVDEYGESVMSEFMHQYIRLNYDLFREGACAELMYNVEILLEWKKTKVAEKEIAKRFAEEAKRN